MGVFKLIAETFFFVFTLANVSSQDVKETANPAEALKMLLQGTGSKYSDDNICKPLNHDGRAMYDYINGDKICYFALKHLYIRKKRYTPLSSGEYKKSECLKRDIVNEVSATVKIDASLCHFMKNGQKDFFYTANTKRKDHYAILEMKPARPGTGPGTQLRVVAIINLEKLINLKKMEEYFMRSFTDMLWETEDEILALKMYMVGGHADKNSSDYVCSPLDFYGKIISYYLNGDKICHLARKRFHPIQLNVNEITRAKCTLGQVIISDGDAESKRFQRGNVTNCICRTADDRISTLFIGNMRKNYYAIFELSRYKDEDTPLLKIHGIFHLECNMLVYEELKTIFTITVPPV